MDKCPVCGNNTLKNRHFRLMVEVFRSVHTKCTSCKTEIVCGYTGEEFIIITHEEYERITNEQRESKTI